ncbi:MAG: YrhC family protein [Bacillota bacterium]
MNKKKLQALMVDFKQYAFILMAVSVFLYIGVALPDQGKEELYDIVLMITTVIFLIGSFICFKASLNYKKQLDKLEEQN